MAFLFTKALTAYETLMIETRDKRVDGYFLMDSYLPTAVIQIVYIYFVLHLGPKLMARRKPFDINPLLSVYNVFQILANAYIFWMFRGVVLDYNFHCNPIDHSETESVLKLVRGCHLYYLIKIVDLLDTIFFVLRKKDGQKSFLHVYHHCLMLTVAWLSVKFVPGGNTVLMPFINAFVHVCMYTYYMLSTYRPTLKGNSWWKRRLTEIQLIQLAVGVKVMSGSLLPGRCNYPAVIAQLATLQYVFMMAMFADFYVKKYVMPSKR